MRVIKEDGVERLDSRDTEREREIHDKDEKVKFITHIFSMLSLQKKEGQILMRK